MPVDFLSAAQIAGYGRYGEPPSARQLERFFHFDDRDRELIADRHGDHNRLGFAVQLATVRFLGTFLAHPAAVPAVVARNVARELAITDPGCLAVYAQREQTHREHAGEIQRAYGYRDFSERTAQAELTGWRRRQCRRGLAPIPDLPAAAAARPRDRAIAGVDDEGRASGRAVTRL